MNDKDSLLERLLTDRSGEDGDDSQDETLTEVRRRVMLAAVGGFLVLVIIAASLWQWRARHIDLLYRTARPARAVRAVSLAPQGLADGRPLAAGEAPTVPGLSVLDASGYIIAQRQATVSARSLGRVRELLIEAGQYVHGGQVIARLDDSNTLAALGLARAQLAQARATLEAARVALADAGPIYRRNEEQHNAGVMSAEDFDAARSSYDVAQTSYVTQRAAVATAQASLRVAERAQDDMIVRAPFSGVVTDRAAQPGEIVSPMATGGFTRTSICTLVDMASLEAEVDVSESLLSRVRPGQPAAVHLNAYPGWTIPGNVVAIMPTADRSKATVKVRVGFKTKDPRILPEMGARVSFLAGPARGAPATKG